MRARVTRLEAGCAELVVLEQVQPPPADEWQPLQVGDVFGGAVSLLCDEPSDSGLGEGDEVLAVFTRGTQSGETCQEYRDCSLQQCGQPNAAYTPVVDAECEAQRAAGGEVDCQTSQQVDEAALVAYDQCDTQCLEQTREVCATHAAEEQLGGSVRIGKLSGADLEFYWAGETRRESVDSLLDEQCQQRHTALSQAYVDERAALRSSTEPTTVTAAPEATPNSTPAQCPLPPRP